MKFIHFKVLHNGVKGTLNELRTRFWISKARKLISSVIKNSFICKKVEGLAFKYPRAPDFPSTRVAFAPAFTHTDVDYAGPVFVKNIYDSQNMYKAWIFIFTCAPSRAICSELVCSCDAGKCMNVLRPFFSKYGVPETILSDNGNQFPSQETQSFISSYGLKWHFNPPLSPWWGGIFDRMVRSVKRYLRKILLGARITYEELETVLREIELTLNNRPLTFTYEIPGDGVLTPSHLVHGRRINTISINQSEEEHTHFEARFIHLSKILVDFTNRWNKEYLLQSREHFKHKNEVLNICNKGDIVLVYEPNKKRADFKTGIIESFEPSQDGKNRIAVVKCMIKERIETLMRLISRLYPIETSPYLMDEDVLPNLKFVNEKNIKTLKQN